MDRGREQGPQAGTSGIQGHVYAIIPPIELVDQPVIQGTFLLSRLWARVLFDSGASDSFIATSVVRELGLKVETLEEPLYMSSPLGTRVSIDLICRGCELETSEILLTVDLRVMDMSEIDVILRIDWLTAYRVAIDYERWSLPPTLRMVLALRFRGTSTTFFPRPCTTPNGMGN